MGFSVDPNATYRYVLNKNKPEAEQPVFVVRYMSARETAEVERIFDESAKLVGIVEIAAKIAEGLSKCLVSIENASSQDVLDVVSAADLIIMRDNLLHELTIDELKKKRSEYSPRSTTGNSAS